MDIFDLKIEGVKQVGTHNSNRNMEATARVTSIIVQSPPISHDQVGNENIYGKLQIAATTWCGFRLKMIDQNNKRIVSEKQE